MRNHYLTLALVLIGCAPKTLGGLPEDSESSSLDTDETLATAADSTAVGTTTGDQTTGDQTTGAEATTAIDPSATTEETTAIDTTTGPAGPQHRACELPFPGSAPALPDVNADDDGTPLFDAWTKIACDDVAAIPTCGGEGDPSCSRCVRGEVDGVGVCTQPDIDIWCDGEGEAINFQGHACWICVDPKLHAQACCEGLPGFDCRTWPYPADGPQGSVCAVHEDCEPGLICGAHKGSGYGICQCPGLDPQTVVPEDGCFEG
jgi:hypothetical protein